MNKLVQTHKNAAHQIIHKKKKDKVEVKAPKHRSNVGDEEWG